MQTVAVALPGQNMKDQALLVRIGEFLVIVPQDREKLIEIYPWLMFFSKGGAKLLEKDMVDGARMQKVLGGCKPAKRMSQTNYARCDRMLRGISLSSVAQ
jgi:hypothetical protein